MKEASHTESRMPMPFLPDKSIESEEEDRFGQSTIVKLLHSAIESTETHMNIGIFGKWGTGKTGVLNMLRKRLEREPYRGVYDYIYVDTWKLSKDSLRQQLLYKLAKQYDQGKTEEDIADILFHTTVERVAVGKESLKQRLTRILGDALPYLIIASVLLLIGFVVDSIYPNRSLMIIVSSIFIIPLIANAISKLAETSKAMTRSVKRIIPRVESPFQFENLFKDIIGKREEGRKTVIALDNLDRCESDLAVEILSTAKTFMETDGVIFVVACDDEALVQHIKRTREYEDSDDAREFIRKFFQTTITIPPFIDGDLFRYVEELAGELTEPVDDEVLEVMIAASIGNPRRIKQFLNNYVMNYQLAQERERKGLVGNGTLTERTAFLAKIIIIRDRFPEFWEELKRREDLLTQIEEYFRGARLEDADEERITEILDRRPELEWFLKSTRTVEVFDVAPFIKLAQEDFESLLPEQEELKLKARHNNFDYVRKLLEKSGGRKKSNIVRVIIKILGEDIRNKRSVWTFNVMNVIVEIFEHVEDSLSSDLLNGFQNHFSSRDVLNELDRFNKRKMFSILHKMRASNRDSVLTQYCEVLVDEVGIERELLDLLVRNKDLLPEESKIVFNESLARLCEMKEELCHEVIEELVVDEEVRISLLNTTTARAIASKLNGADSLGKNEKRVELFRKLADLANMKTQTEYVRSLLGVLPEEPPNTLNPMMQLVIDTIRDLNDEDVSTQVANHLFETLPRYMRPIGDENQKVQFLIPIVHHFHKLSEKQRLEFIESEINPRLSSGPPDIVIDIMEAFSISDFNVLDNPKVFGTLVSRAETNIQDQRLLNLLIESSSEEQKESIVGLLVSNIKSGDPSRQNITLNSFGDYNHHLQPKEVDRVCTTIIDVAHGMGPDAKPPFFGPLVLAFPNCSQNLKQKIVDEILVVIKQPEPLRSKGLEYYRELREHMQEKRILQVLRQIVFNLNVLGPLVQEIRPILDLIKEDLDILEQDEIVRLIDYLQGYISTAEPEETQMVAMEYVFELPRLYQRGGGMLEAVLHVSKSGSEEVRELGKKIHQKFRKHKLPDNHWKEAAEVFGNDVGP